MDEKIELKRGQMWKVLFGDGVGAEIKVTRPGIIISSDIGNATSTVVTVVYTTTTPRKGSVTAEINSCSRLRSFALCNQIDTIDKSRLSQCYGSVTESEMAAIDLCVRKALALPLKVENDISVFQREIEQLKSNVSGLEVELAVYKRLYERALDKIVEDRFTKDLTPEPEIVAEPEIIAEPEPELDLTGLAEKFNVLDERLEQKRRGRQPKEKIETPKVRAPKEKIETPSGRRPWSKPKDDWITANINTDTMDEIHEKTGLGRETCRAIVAYRNKHGAFKDVSDLLNIDRVGTKVFNVYSERLEV
jgi:mRNA interferase MazF